MIVAGAAKIAFDCAPPNFFDPSLYVTPFLVAISTAIAFFALRNTRSVARQKATLDLVEKVESSDHYRAIAVIFSQLRLDEGFAALSNPSDTDKIKRRAVLDHLNHYEIVAIGIRQNILDARIYRAWMEGTFVRDWNAIADWVQRERWKQDKAGKWSYRESIYANYQWAACRWSKDAIRLTKASSSPPTQAAGPGDQSLPDPLDPVTLND